MLKENLDLEAKRQKARQRSDEGGEANGITAEKERFMTTRMSHEKDKKERKEHKK